MKWQRIITLFILGIIAITATEDVEARTRGVGLGIQSGAISGVSFRIWLPARLGFEGDIWLEQIGAKVLIRVAEDPLTAVYWGGGVGFSFAALEGFRLKMIIGMELTPQAVRSLAFSLEVGLGAIFDQITYFYPTSALGVYWYF